MDCRGDYCGGGCTYEKCTSGCTGLKCGALCVGYRCAFACTGTDCGEGCHGEDCNAAAVYKTSPDTSTCEDISSVRYAMLAALGWPNRSAFDVAHEMACKDPLNAATCEWDPPTLTCQTVLEDTPSTASNGPSSIPPITYPLLSALKFTGTAGSYEITLVENSTMPTRDFGPGDWLVIGNMSMTGADNAVISDGGFVGDNLVVTLDVALQYDHPADTPVYVAAGVPTMTTATGTSTTVSTVTTTSTTITSETSTTTSGTVTTATTLTSVTTVTATTTTTTTPVVTFVTQSAVAGDKVLSVADTSKFALGDEVMLAAGTPSEETAIVVDIVVAGSQRSRREETGGHLVFNDGLLNDHPTSTDVVRTVPVPPNDEDDYPSIYQDDMYMVITTLAAATEIGQYNIQVVVPSEYPLSIFVVGDGYLVGVTPGAQAAEMVVVSSVGNVSDAGVVLITLEWDLSDVHPIGTKMWAEKPAANGTTNATAATTTVAGQLGGGEETAPPAADDGDDSYANPMFAELTTLAATTVTGLFVMDVFAPSEPITAGLGLYVGASVGILGTEYVTVSGVGNDDGSGIIVLTLEAALVNVHPSGTSVWVFASTDDLLGNGEDTAPPASTDDDGSSSGDGSIQSSLGQAARALDTTITVDDGDPFDVGDTITLSVGDPTKEEVRTITTKDLLDPGTSRVTRLGLNRALTRDHPVSSLVRVTEVTTASTRAAVTAAAPTQGAATTKKKKKKESPAMAIGIACGVGLVAIVLLLLLRKRDRSPSQQGFAPMYMNTHV